MLTLSLSFFNRMHRVLGMLWIACILGLTPGFAQSNGECGTGPAPASTLRYLESLASTYDAQTEDTVWIRLPVTAHIVRSSSGFGGMSESAVFATICNLNERFVPARISFYLTERVKFIDNTSFYGATSYQPLMTMIDQNNVPRTINIYYTDLSGMSLCGFAFYPLTGPGGFQNDGAVVMSFGCSQPQGTTLAHELGHYLNLPHTFDETSSNPVDPIAERVTRNFNEVAPRLSANCFTAGDRFCDTPSDFIASRWACPSSRVQLDLNGDLFRPDSSYYMSYSNDNCMSRFSPQQMAAMRATVNSPSAPRGYLTLTPPPVFGTLVGTPTKIFPQITDTVVPNNALFRWHPQQGANLYQLRIFQFNVNVFDTLVPDTFYHALGNRLRGVRQYSWVVRGLNGGDLCSAFSPRDSFSTSTYVFAGINENTASWQAKVYPTLFREGDPLTLAHIQPGIPLVWKLTDHLGRQVCVGNLLPEDFGALLHLPGDLPTGSYRLELRQNQQRMTVKLLRLP
jgi:hypothetical protein